MPPPSHNHFVLLTSCGVYWHESTSPSWNSIVVSAAAPSVSLSEALAWAPWCCWTWRHSRLCDTRAARLSAISSFTWGKQQQQQQQHQHILSKMQQPKKATWARRLACSKRLVLASEGIKLPFQTLVWLVFRQLRSCMLSCEGVCKAVERARASGTLQCDSAGWMKWTIYKNTKTSLRPRLHHLLLVRS